jgi:hypothetical protein
MKNSQQKYSRGLTALALGIGVGIGVLGGSALAQDKAKVQLPQQVLPTGEEDAAAPAAAARSTLSATSAATDKQRLEQQLLDMTKESTEGLKVVRRADGSRAMDLQGQFMSVAIATPAKNGGYVLSCQTGESAVEHAKHAHDVETGKAPKVLIKQAVSKQQPALEEK